MTILFSTFFGPIHLNLYLLKIFYHILSILYKFYIVRSVNEFIQIDIKVFPGASKNEITGIRDNRLCIRVCAAPEDGKANACLCEFLSKTLGCAKRDIVLVKGEKSRLKTIAVPAALENKLKEITLQVSAASLDQASSPLPWKRWNPCP
jgi:uncharacterized protein (TIGR00251 family)